MNYDAILVVSFGGPERPEDVMPFLENVLRGKNVPRERMLGVAEHYYLFGGKSPINEQNRRLIAALEAELKLHGPNLPVYWGNRNWHPMLADTLRQMKADGIHRALAFVTSAYSSYSSCRQYREDIARAQEAVGEGAPVVDKIRVFYNHPRFVEALADRVNSALAKIPPERRETARLIYTAHSIPLGMAQTSDYEKQLRETGRLVAERLGRENKEWQLVYPEPKRAPSSTLVGARHSRLPPRNQGAGRKFGSGGSAHRFRFRPHGNHLRPGYPSARTLRRIGPEHGASGDGRNSSQIHQHDSRTDTRTDQGQPAAALVGRPWDKAGCVS